MVLVKALNFYFRNSFFKESVTAALRTLIVKTDCFMACDGKDDDTVHSHDLKTTIVNYFV